MRWWADQDFSKNVVFRKKKILPLPLCVYKNNRVNFPSEIHGFVLCVRRQHHQNDKNVHGSPAAGKKRHVCDVGG